MFETWDYVDHAFFGIFVIYSSMAFVWYQTFKPDDFWITALVGIIPGIILWRIARYVIPSPPIL
jgi:hypothetical protein